MDYKGRYNPLSLHEGPPWLWHQKAWLAILGALKRPRTHVISTRLVMWGLEERHMLRFIMFHTEDWCLISIYRRRLSRILNTSLTNRHTSDHTIIVVDFETSCMAHMNRILYIIWKVIRTRAFEKFDIPKVFVPCCTHAICPESDYLSQSFKNDRKPHYLQIVHFGFEILLRKIKFRMSMTRMPSLAHVFASLSDTTLVNKAPKTWQLRIWNIAFFCSGLCQGTFICLVETKKLYIGCENSPNLGVNCSQIEGFNTQWNKD